MTVEQLLAALEAHDVRLTVVDRRLSVDAPRGALTPELRQALAEHRDALLTRLMAGIDVIPVQPRDGRTFPLSHAQHRLWLLDRLERGTARYNLVSATRLIGSLDVAAVRRALRALIARHEVLRTRIVMAGGDAVQIPLDECAGDLRFDDRTRVPAGDVDSAVLAACREESAVVFDLASPPLLRARLLQFAADRHVLILNVHHLVADLWSMDVFAREFASLYAGATVTPLPLQYADYAVWQRQAEDGESLERGLAFWSAHLRDSLELLPLPTDYARPATMTYRGASTGIAIPRALVDALNRVGRDTQASLFMVLHAALAVVLARLSGSDDLAIGVPVTNRPKPELDGLIGFFINSVVLRSRIDPRATFRSLVSETRDKSLAAFAHQDTPFEKVVESLKVRRDLSYSPLFQVMFSFMHRVPDAPAAAGLRAERMAIPPSQSLFDLDWQIRETADGLTGFLTYAADLFAPATAERMVRQFVRVLDAVAAHPETAVAEIDLLTAGERHEVLERWNATGAGYPRDRAVHELFEDQATRTPEAVAITYAGESWSYRELSESSDRVAAALRRRGVTPGALVAVCAERRPRTIAGLIGILKCGAAYVPLDPGFPPDRLVYMATDAGVALTLSDADVDRSLRDRLAGVAPVHLLVDLDAEAAGDAPGVAVSPESPMYVIYTSGSTGTPKGVVLPHRALANFLESMRKRPGLDATHSLLAVTTMSFDIAVLEIFLPLVTGARIVLADRLDAADPHRLMRLLESESVTVMQATPATWRMLLTAGWRGAPGLTALCGGEALPGDLAQALRSRCRALWNMYGPTETAVWSAIHEVSPAGDHAGVQPIGRPIANTRIYIVDRALAPVPVGAVGELCIGGDGVALGYWQRPELTMERFVLDPFSLTPGMRMYRTGDRARFRADGTIDFLGRLDQQVKLRGFRIELGEIESVLGRHPQVAQSALVIREDVPGDQRLVAYWVPAGGEDVNAAVLREHLRRALPEYMIPSAFVSLPSLPLTPNGKIDRRRLPSPEHAGEGGATPPARAPSGDLEIAIGQVWERLLALRNPDRDANFFDLGGHSLLIIQLHQQLVERHGAAIDVLDLFRHPTIRQQALLVAGKTLPRDVQSEARGVATRQQQRPAFEPIAIVGMACRFPGAPDVGTFWRNLRQGVESIHVFSEAELRAAGVSESLFRQPGYVPAHGRLDHLDAFDAEFFGVSPRDASLLDPQHRLFLECAWDAIEHAGYNPETVGERFGVVAGAGLNTYLLHNILPRADIATPANAYSLFVANDKDFLPTRVSYKLNLRGPSLNVNTACSSSLVAISTACQMLWSHQCDGVLAGGVSLQVPQDAGYLHQAGGITSPDGRCRAFDASANGTVTGSGAGAVVLKRLSDAEAAGDTIHAVIRGAATNNDGALKAGFTAPSAEGQAAVIAEAMAIGDVPATSVGYVEAHGTGTSLGDPIEVAALTHAFGPAPGRQSCAIGSVKTNIGHLDAAAGIAGLIKTTLALTHGEIPPSLHFRAANPKIDFAGSPFRVCAELTPWPRAATPRRAGVSSFGIGGTNAHVVLEEAAAASRAPCGAGEQLCVVSARTPAALERACRRLADHVEAADARLEDVAWTLAAGRKVFAHVATAVASSRDELARALRSGNLSKGERPGAPSEVAFVFPGQGAQQVGAGRALYEEDETFRAAFDECAAAVVGAGGPDVRALLFRDATPEADAELRRTVNAQTALFVLGCALAAWWKQCGIIPAGVLGHSSGEYAAAVCAGVMDLADAARALVGRARLMEQLPPGAMAAVGLAEAELRAMLPRGLHIAAVNAASLCTVAGDEPALGQLEARLADRSVLFRRLQTAHAFHSPAIDPVLPSFERVMARVPLCAPQMAFYSAVTGTRAGATDITDRALWVRQVREPVLFGPALDALVADGHTAIVELGPGATLTSLVRRAASKGTVVVAGLPQTGERRALLTALGQLWRAGASLEWPSVIGDRHPKRVPLPTYPFERTRHWIEPMASVAPSVAGDPIGRRDLSDWVYVPSWMKAPPLVRAPGGVAGNWLVFARRHAFDEGIVSELRREGATVTVVHPGDVEDYELLLDRLRSRDAAPDRILHCWTIDVTDGTQFQELGFNALLQISRACSRGGHQVRELAVVTRGLADVHGHEPLNPRAACLLGPVMVIPAECPGMSCRCIDLDERAVDRAADIVRDLSHPAQTPVTAWRAKDRWLPRFEAMPLPAAEAEPFREGGTYLITGGAGGLGLILAEHLAKTVHARLILTGRRTLPPESEWDALAAQTARRSTLDVQPADLERDVIRLQHGIEQSLSIRTLEDRPGLEKLGNALASASAFEYFLSRGVFSDGERETTRTRVHAQCEVVPAFARLVDHLLNVLAQDGWIALNGDSIRLVNDARSLPSAAELQREIAARHPGMAPEFEVLATCVRGYADALGGRVPAISVLFPDGGRGLTVEAAERTDEHKNNRVYRTLLADLIAELASRHPERRLRILEVGGGNAILAALVAERLRGRNVEYVFTDIGPSFVMAAEAKSRELGYAFMKFATFDISRDPASQGFQPGSFDLVIGLDVVHATSSIRESAGCLRALLAAGGLMCLVESARTYRWNDMVWGLAEGWWAFTDGALRNPNSPLLSTDRWDAALAGCGFSSVLAFPRSAEARAKTDCSLILAQRPAGGADAPAGAETFAALSRIRRYASALHVAQVDVADEGAMARLVAEAEKRFGRIDGVVHAAAVESKSLIASREQGVEDLEFRPKVDGTLVLDRVFRHRPLDFLVLYSSITAVIGGAGQVGYCGANAFLDAFACARSRERGELTVSINWGRWQGAGLAKDFESWHQARTGRELVGGMTAEEGIEVLRRILAHRIGPRAAVMTGEWRPGHLAAREPASREMMTPAVPPTGAPAAEAAAVFAGSVLEQRLAAIWRQILGAAEFDRHTVFQDLGGDSLIGIQMIARIREDLAVQLPIHVVFDCPTIAALAGRIEQAQAAGVDVEMEEGSV